MSSAFLRSPQRSHRLVSLALAPHHHPARILAQRLDPLAADHRGRIFEVGKVARHSDILKTRPP